MLDALMGTDRDASLPSGAAVSHRPGGGEGNWNSRKTKRSCYDSDICPLYCAWGVDMYELFTNTKSDLGPNPYVVQADAREEFMSLPDHEKERLGYEHMLHRKLGDLVRGCDRVVARNRDKLRAEMAKTSRARGSNGGSDPVTSVKDEMVTEASDCIAELELREDKLKEMVFRIEELESEERKMWRELNIKEKDPHEEEEKKANIEDQIEKRKMSDEKTPECSKTERTEQDNGLDSGIESKAKEGALSADDDEMALLNTMEENISAAIEEEVETIDVEKKYINNAPTENTEPHTDGILEEDKTLSVDEKENKSELNGEENVEQKSDIEDESEKDEKRTKLYELCKEKQKLLASITILIATKIAPQREILQNLQKQLYYVRNDTTSDKTVCEISGNFMSSRDADERIAAHYAGKQYVGWKMVRDKYQELQKKYNGGRGMPPARGFRSGGGGEYGPPPPRAYSYGGPHNGHHRPGNYGPPRGPPPGQWERDRWPRDKGYNRDNERRRERSRSRDRDRDRDRERDRDNRGRRRRGPSPPGSRGYRGRDARGH